MSRFAIGDTLEVLTLPLGEKDRELRGYKHFRFTVGKINTVDDIHFYAPDSSITGWRARYLNKVDPE
jgi:hypothetical protein